MTTDTSERGLELRQSVTPQRIACHFLVIKIISAKSALGIV